MAGISAIGSGGGIENLQIQAEYTARIAKMTQNAVDLQGNLALKLIQSTTALSAGNNLNITV